MRSEQVKDAQPSRDALKKRSSTSDPISLEDLKDKEVLLSSQDGAIRELSVLANPSNGHSTKIKRKIRILDHPKNLIEVLWARLAIEKWMAGNAIATGPNQYRFTRTFLNGEALRIFDLKATELVQETVANLKIVMNKVVTYFGRKEWC